MTASRPDLTALLALAVDAAEEAGALLLDSRPQRLSSEAKSTPTDPVTEMDRASEELLVRRLQAARPHDGVLSEEGAKATGSSGIRWVLDPIDGTVNYLYGLPPWAVSVAAELDGQAVVGVVRVPARDETFAAVRGGGAFLNGRALPRRESVPIEMALVATGFAYASARRARQGLVVSRLLPRVRDIRRGGSAAVDLCDLAAGRVDAYYERGVQAWDTAAGALVAVESGVRVSTLAAALGEPDGVVAARGRLCEDLLTLLEDIGPGDEAPAPAHVVEPAT